jgi:hypothetical protein
MPHFGSAGAAAAGSANGADGFGGSVASSAFCRSANFSKVRRELAFCHATLSNFVESRRCSTVNTNAVLAAAACATTTMLPTSSSTNSTAVALVSLRLSLLRSTANGPAQMHSTES